MKTSWHCDFVIITGASTNTVNNSIVICSPIIGSYNIGIHTGHLPFSQVSLSGEPVACLACHLELLTFGYKCLHMKMFRCLEDNNQCVYHHVVRRPISFDRAYSKLCHIYMLQSFILTWEKSSPTTSLYSRASSKEERPTEQPTSSARFNTPSWGKSCSGRKLATTHRETSPWCSLHELLPKGLIF